MKHAGIVGTGLYLPETIRTNEWFSQCAMLPFDELFDNAGVASRRVCAPGEKASDMEAKALLDAVRNAGLRIRDVELILVGTNLPDQPQPGNAALVQYKAGAKNAAAINVESACTSLLSQIAVATGLIRSGMYATIACVGSANWTIAADYTEKNCMFIGDGAAALIMQPVKRGRGVLSTHLETDGSCWGAVGRNFRLPRALIENYTPGNYLEGPRERVYFYIDRGDDGVGKIRRHGPTRIPAAAKKALVKAGLRTKDIDFLITHNPAPDLVDAWRKALGVPPEKCHTTFEKYGNMSSATIGANLHEAVTMGKIKNGDLVVICGPGAGFHYSAAVMRWGK